MKSLTPFEETLLAIVEGKLTPPDVNYEGKKIDYIGYQLATTKYALGLYAKGIRLDRHFKVTDYKKYYGLKGKTPQDVLKSFMVIYDDYMSGNLTITIDENEQK